MQLHVRLIVALGCLVLAAPVAAQDTLSSVHVVASDSDSASWEAGLREGRESANDALVAHRGLIGFVLGIPIGVYLLPAVYSANPLLIAAEGAGVAAVVGVGRAGSADPPATLVEQAATRGPEYARGLREGYAQRLRSRRMKAVAGGAAAGMVSGTALLIWAILQTSD
jgi:hypothetical protein